MNLRGRHELDLECVCMWRPLVHITYLLFFYHPLCYFLRFFSEPGLTSWLNSLASEPPGSPCLHLLSAGITDMCNYVYLAFCIGFGDLLSSCLCKKYFKVLSLLYTRRGISIALPPQLFYIIEYYLELLSIYHYSTTVFIAMFCLS